MNGKLWQALCALTGTELKQLGWFLDSPYHNRRADVRDLFDVLKVARAADLPPEKRDVWVQVYPDRSWSDPDFRHLCRYLLARIEEFLAINAFRRQNALQLGVAEAYDTHGLPDLAAAVRERISKKLEKGAGHRAQGLLEAFRLEQMRYQAHAQGARSFRPGLQGISDALDRWYLVQKLKLACTMGSQQKVFRAEYELGLLDPVLEMAVQDPWRDEPLVALYERTYAMVSGRDAAQAYRDQARLLAAHQQLLTDEEARTLYLMAINFCIRQLNQGLQEYLPEVYGLYKKGLADRWLFERGQLSPWTYKNVVSAGLKLRDFDWIGDFIADFRADLPEDVRFTFHQYNLAELQLARREFPAVLRTLRFLQIKDPLTQLRGRILQIKAGFELGEFRLVESQLDNLQRLLRRKKELAYHREAYRNFERFLRRLMGLAPGEGRADLLADLEGEEIVAEKDWLGVQCE